MCKDISSLPRSSFAGRRTAITASSQGSPRAKRNDRTGKPLSTISSVLPAHCLQRTAAKRSSLCPAAARKRFVASNGPSSEIQILSASLFSRKCAAWCSCQHYKCLMTFCWKGRNDDLCRTPCCASPPSQGGGHDTSRRLDGLPVTGAVRQPLR